MNTEYCGAIVNNSENIALAGMATQSSTGYSGDPSRAIDDNTNGSYSGNSVTHTGIEANPWWQVELNEETSIGDINIYGRTDSCCKDRLSNFTVSVIDINGNITFSKVFDTFPDPSFGINAGGVEGKVIKVVSNTESGVLSLSEVQVYKSSILSIGEDNELDKSINLYPNPVSEELTISLSNANLNISDTTVCIYNINGQTVLKTSSNSSDEIMVNTSFLSKGVYWVVVNDMRKKIIKKLIKI